MIHNIVDVSSATNNVYRKIETAQVSCSMQNDAQQREPGGGLQGQRDHQLHSRCQSGNQLLHGGDGRPAAGQKIINMECSPHLPDIDSKRQFRCCLL